MPEHSCEAQVRTRGIRTVNAGRQDQETRPTICLIDPSCVNSMVPCCHNHGREASVRAMSDAPGPLHGFA